MPAADVWPFMFLVLFVGGVADEPCGKHEGAILMQASFDGKTVARKHTPATSNWKRKDATNQHLVICNGYTSRIGLDVFHVQTSERLTATPVRYKECRELYISIAEGDQLDFKAADTEVGTFYATGLPNSSSSLLLVPHRVDVGDDNGTSPAVKFESHAFADLRTPQIAVVDAFKGTSDPDGIKIMYGQHGDARQHPGPAEILQFSTVVAVNPGNYKVALNKSRWNVSLLVEDQSKCVVMRVGDESNETKGKPLFPEELIVFPRSCSSNLKLWVSSLAVVAWIAVAHLL